MREVVVTGIGIVSSIGNNVEEVTESLKTLKSGIVKNEINSELGLSLIHISEPTNGLLSRMPSSA